MKPERELTTHVGLGEYAIAPAQAFTYFHDINRRTYVSLDSHGISLETSREWDAPGGSLRLTWDELREFLRQRAGR